MIAYIGRRSPSPFFAESCLWMDDTIIWFLRLFVLVVMAFMLYKILEDEE
jgi:hypothetical protein